MSPETWRILRGINGAICALLAIGSTFDRDWSTTIAWAAASLSSWTSFTVTRTVTVTTRVTTTTTQTSPEVPG